MKKKADDSKSNYWNEIRDFNLSRTNIWILIALQLVETILPFLCLWLLFSPDFQTKSFDYYSTMKNPTWLFVVLSLAFIVWALGINFATFFLKWQKADSFTFTISFSFVCWLILINGLWMSAWDVRLSIKIFLRVLICLLGLIPAMFLGLVVTSLMRNWTYKIEEDNEAILLAYEEGTEIPDKKKLKLARALKARKEREDQATELIQFREELEEKVNQSLEEQKQKDLALQKKLDAKEAKQRERASKKKNRPH